jgi:hypothetical protein
MAQKNANASCSTTFFDQFNKFVQQPAAPAGALGTSGDIA